MAGRAAGESGACRTSAYDARTGAEAAPQSAKQYPAAAQPGRQRVRAAESHGPD